MAHNNIFVWDAGRVFHLQQEKDAVMDFFFDVKKKFHAAPILRFIRYLAHDIGLYRYGHRINLGLIISNISKLQRTDQQFRWQTAAFPFTLCKGFFLPRKFVM